MISKKISPPSDSEKKGYDCESLLVELRPYFELNPHWVVTLPHDSKGVALLRNWVLFCFNTTLNIFFLYYHYFVHVTTVSS